MKNKNLSIKLFFLGLFVFMFLINIWTPESLQDDILYKFKFNIDGSRPTELIGSWKDLLESQYAHWFIKNGRFVPHFLSQLFDGLLGKGLFNFVNSVVICLLIYLTSKFISGKANLLYCAVSLACLLFLSPAPKETLFWYDGSFNYLWSYVFVLVFLIILKYIWKEPSKVKYWLLGPLMILLGNVNEASTIPVCLVLGVYIISDIKNIHERAILPFSLFFFVGVGLNVFAPATFTRIEAANGASTSILARCITVIVAILQSRLFWVWLVVLIYTLLRHKMLLKEYLQKYWFVTICIPFSYTVFFLSDMHYDRLRFSAEMFSLLGLITWIDFYRIDSKYPKLSILFCLLSIGILVPITIYAHENYNNYHYCEKQLKEANKTIILTKTDTIPDLMNPYIMKHVDFGFKRAWYLACDPNHEYTQLMAKFYKKKELRYIPEDLYHDIQTNPDKYKQLATVPHCELMAIEVPTTKMVKNITFILKPAENIPIFLKPIAKHINRFSAKTAKTTGYITMDINGHNYCLMVKPLKELADRINDVNIEFK